MENIPKSIIGLIEKKVGLENEFIPGKSIIRLIEPTFGAPEIIEALDSLVTTQVTMGKKVKKFEIPEGVDSIELDFELERWVDTM